MQINNSDLILTLPEALILQAKLFQKKLLSSIYLDPVYPVESFIQPILIVNTFS